MKNAEAMSSGLMTTFDIAVLLRNAKKHGWPTSTILPVFYRTGRILAIPSHYQHVGSIGKRWKQAIGIVPVSPIALGDRIAFSRVGMDYIETVVTSLHVDDKSVNIASAGSNCGIAIPEDVLLREGLEVYVVKPWDEGPTSQEVLVTNGSKT